MLVKIDKNYFNERFTAYYPVKCTNKNCNETAML